MAILIVLIWQVVVRKRKKEENKNSRIEEDVMDAASKYIESIMSNNSR